jgi:hypothetical protein
VNLIQYNPIGEGKFDHRSVEAERKICSRIRKSRNYCFGEEVEVETSMQLVDNWQIKNSGE